jgi:dihydropyrimidinase
MHMNMDHSAYEGFEISGGVHTVISRGTTIVEQGGYVGVKGHGQYLRRGLSQFLV